MALKQHLLGRVQRNLLSVVQHFDVTQTECGEGTKTFLSPVLVPVVANPDFEFGGLNFNCGGPHSCREWPTVKPANCALNLAHAMEVGGGHG